MAIDSIARGLAGWLVSIFGRTGSEVTSSIRAMAADTGAAVTLTGGAYTTTGADLDNLLLVTTGSSHAAITLLSAANAGADAVQGIAKADNTFGSVKIYEGTTLLAVLRRKGDVALLRSTGLEWRRYLYTENPSMYVSGRYYPVVDPVPGGVTGAVPAADTLYATLMDLQDIVSIDALGIRVTTIQAGSQAKFAIYDINPSNVWKPDGGALLAYSGAVSTNTAEAIGVLNAAVRLRRAWFVTKFTTSGSLPTVSTMGGNSAYRIGGSTLQEMMSFTTTTLKGFSASDAFANAFPVTFPTSSVYVGNAMPIGGVRIA